MTAVELGTGRRCGSRSLWVGVLDPVRARVSPVARLSGIANQCQQGAPDPGHTYVVCLARDGAVAVWRYRPV